MYIFYISIYTKKKLCELNAVLCLENSLSVNIKSSKGHKMQLIENVFDNMV